MTAGDRGIDLEARFRDLLRALADVPDIARLADDFTAYERLRAVLEAHHRAPEQVLAERAL